MPNGRKQLEPWVPEVNFPQGAERSLSVLKEPVVEMNQGQLELLVRDKLERQISLMNDPDRAYQVVVDHLGDPVQVYKGELVDSVMNHPSFQELLMNVDWANSPFPMPRAEAKRMLREQTLAQTLEPMTPSRVD